VSHDEFDQFVRETAPAIRRYALSLTRDQWLAEDISQETFLRAWRYWHSYRGESSREAWVVRICRNTTFDTLAKREVTMARESKEVPADDAGYEEVLIRDELLGLSLPHREVIVLVDLLGFDYASVAEILECRTGTVRSRLSRARESLREARSSMSSRMKSA
jgi:RNA polymerase sigma-70 factor (ECF subfamily)